MRRRRIAGAMALALALPAGVVALAVTIAAPAASAAPATPDPGSDAAASAQAVATGKPVTVANDTTSYTDTVANPDGTFTWTSSHEPRHARKNGAWVTPDATLRANADGTLSPAAAASGLVLSGGGGGPLATFDDSHGHTLSVTLPATLPKPTLSGDTATYRSVLDGVDLVVTANVRGGLSEVLVVQNAKAAANPLLAQLRLALGTSGLSMTTDSSGALDATDPKTGRPVFSAPPPLMWDSTPQSAAAQAHGQGADPAETRPAKSGVHGPGAAARVTEIPVHPGSGAVTLAPPSDALVGADVTYPLYIDPSINPTTNPEAYTQSNHTSTVAYNPSDNLRTGFSDWPGTNGWVPGITRTYLAFDIGGVFGGKHITDAHLQLTEIASSDQSTSNYYRVETGLTAYWGSNIDWANQPSISNPPGHYTDIPGVPSGQSHDYQITITDIVQTCIDNNWPAAYMGLQAGDEQNDLKYKHWALNPQLVVTYWSTPNQPTGLAVHNGTATYNCNTTSPGTWIPAASSNQITLSESVSTPDADTDLTVNTYPKNTTSMVSYLWPPQTTHQTGSTPVTVSQSMTLVDGASYNWYTTASNAYLTSTPSSTCYFRYDATAPGPLTVSSTAYPAAGPTTVTSGGSGSITFNATDGGTNPSGVAGYYYSLNGASAQYTTATSVSVALSALHWGTNTISVRATDNAGNLSQPVNYSFYVQQSAFGAYTPGTAGDVDGDNKPDLVTVDAAGNLRLFSNPDATSVDPTGDTTADPRQYGGKVLIPYNSDTLWPNGTFAGALVTHAGSFIGKNADDLIIQQSTNLGIAENPSASGAPWTIVGVDKPQCPACGDEYNNNDWSSVIQMVALPGTAGGRPNLLTIEFVKGSANVWLYTASGIGFNAPIKISGYTAPWHWDEEQIIGAGPLPGTTGTSIWVRDVIGAKKLRVLHNVEAGLPTPDSVAVTLSTGVHSPDIYPLMTTVGRADANGNLPLWATDTSGRLTVIPTTTNSTGTTTVGTAATRSGTGWANHEQALQNEYAPYNNMGISLDGTASPGQSFDNDTASYNQTALANVTLGNGVTVECPPTTATCVSGFATGKLVTVPETNATYQFTLPSPWGHRPDNYQAAGQVLPVPLSPNAPASSISFLGAGTAVGSAGASATILITYTDGGTQQLTVTLSDWTLGGGRYTPAAGNVVVCTSTYRENTTTAAIDQTPENFYATAGAQLLDNGVALGPNVQIASITLPTNSSFHIFAVALN